MISRISGKEDDLIKIRETAHLAGEGARGFLSSRVAATGNARAEVYNKLIASALMPGDILIVLKLQGQCYCQCYTNCEVNHPKAHITHETALGSVDSKQLQTLMARGLNEEEATDLIILGLLS